MRLGRQGTVLENAKPHSAIRLPASRSECGLAALAHALGKPPVPFSNPARARINAGRSGLRRQNVALQSAINNRAGRRG